MLSKPRAYILAGGRSTRFGSDKALAVLAGQTLLERSVGVLRGWECAVTIVAREAGQYELPGARTIGDVKPNCGPVGGLLTVMTDALAQGGSAAEWVVVTSCDLAELRAAWLDQLQAQTASLETQAIVFRESSEGNIQPRWQPFPGMYRLSLLGELQARVEREDLAVWRLLESISTQALPLPGDWPEVPQINTVEEWRRRGGMADG